MSISICLGGCCATLWSEVLGTSVAAQPRRWREPAPWGYERGLENCTVMCEKSHRLIERVCQGTLFTGRAKRSGQTPGEMFLLARSGETLLLSPSVAPASSPPLHSATADTAHAVEWVFWKVPPPYRLHTPFTFHAALFSSACVGYYFTGGALCWLSLPLCP